MLEQPGMISALLELIDDADPNVVKRTIRVFTNVYRHSLALLADGSLDPSKYMACYEEIDSVSTKLIALLKIADNEGVLIHLVRYLEAALLSHIMANLTDYPEIANTTIPMVKKGVNALLDFVRTPHVSGIPFCVAIRALLTVTRHQADMRPLVTNLIDQFITSPPPNLFDHNVRSFHKTIQRSVFQLLRRTDLSAEKETLVDLLVRVGVPRRKLKDFVPRNSKRSSTSKGFATESPPAKKLKPSVEEIIKFIPASKTSNSLSNKNSSLLPKPTASKINSPVPLKRSSPDLTPSIYPPDTQEAFHLVTSASPESQGSNTIPNQDLPEREPRKGRLTSKAASVLDSILSSSVRSENGDLCSAKPAKCSNRKLTALLCHKIISQSSETKPSSKSNKDKDKVGEEPSSKSPNSLKNRGVCSKFVDRCNEKEVSIYNALTLDRVIDMLLVGCSRLPEQKPSFLPNISLDNEERMREKLAVLLALSLPGDGIGLITLDESSKKHLDDITGSKETEQSSSDSENQNPNASELHKKEIPLTDFPGDVDMRSMTLSRDPRTRGAHSSPKQESYVTVDLTLPKQDSLSNVTDIYDGNRDPRLSKSNPTGRKSSEDPQRMNLDHSLSSGSSKSLHSPNDNPRNSKYPNTDPRVNKLSVHDSFECSNMDPRLAKRSLHAQGSSSCFPSKSGASNSEIQRNYNATNFCDNNASRHMSRSYNTVCYFNRSSASCMPKTYLTKTSCGTSRFSGPPHGRGKIPLLPTPPPFSFRKAYKPPLLENPTHE